MWIFLNDAALSVVQDRDDASRLLVRSRVKGDIETAIPGAKVFQDRSADYRYRSFVSREELKRAMDAAVDRIDYGNFKNSVKNRKRHDAYMGVWAAMANVFGAYGGLRSFFGSHGASDEPTPEEMAEMDLLAPLR